MKKIKVLQVIPKFGITDGISHYLMNYYLHCDLSVLQIDFFLITEGIIKISIIWLMKIMEIYIY